MERLNVTEADVSALQQTWRTPWRNGIARLARLAGVDRAVAYTVVGRGTQILVGPVSIVLLARGLTAVEQGFYYTFASVLAMQIFFELGLSTVIVQFASHEKAHLAWGYAGVLTGPDTPKNRLRALMTSSLRWYAIAAILLVLTLIPAGLLFFGRSAHQLPSDAWRWAWIFLVLTTATRLLATPLFAVLEGCGLIAEVAAVRLGQDLLGYPVLWTALWLGAGLFSSVISQTVYVLTTFGWLGWRKRAFLEDLISRRVDRTLLSWRMELWPLQWRIALSWLSGYFIFQLFNPVAFAFLGPAAAGRMGMGLVIANAVSTIAMAWVATRAPAFGQLIARRAFTQLDALFFRSVTQAMLVSVLTAAAALVVVRFLRVSGYALGTRLLEPLPLILLIIGAIANVFIFSLATYLRAHKREPFLALSMVGAVITSLSTYFLGRNFGLLGMSAGYCASNVVFGVTGSLWIFIRKRREWHA
jgi:hypothetical protein